MLSQDTLARDGESIGVAPSRPALANTFFQEILGGFHEVRDFMTTTLSSLVDAIEAGASAQVRTLNVLPEAERHRVLYEWNQVSTDFPADGCIHELFEEQVRVRPDAPALVYQERTLSYSELNRSANRLAHRLRELGVGPDTRVAICADRGFDMVVALLAVLKAGGAYVPLDPAYPVERLHFALQDSAPIVALTQKHLEGFFFDVGKTLPVLLLDTGPTLCQNYPDTNLSRSVTGLASNHLAYVIYTSGSTGTPKGVMVEHANLLRLFVATDPWFRFSEKDVWTLFHSYAFDFSVWEIWGALVYGGRLVLVSKDTARSPEDFYHLICQEKVTILNQTPSAFKQLITAQSKSNVSHQLRRIIFGGEALEVAILKPWYEQNRERPTQLINMYGITETTVHVTYRPLSEDDVSGPFGRSIGCRIPDLRVYILDSRRQPVPVGVIGELYVGGAGVARGYLNRPELTAERFLRDPFHSVSGARMYKTGDLGKWQPDGNIEFLGRNDFQVKIRGFRIELGEIEARLMEHPGVGEAIVIAREDAPGEARLVAYYTLAQHNHLTGERVGTKALRSHLSARLPEHMVPAACVRLPAMPLTVNGKLDRKALPAPGADAFEFQEYEAPAGETEKKLAAMWSRLLKLDRIGRLDSFFDLGGDSLLAARMIARAGAAFGTRPPLFAFIQTPTIAYLASLLAGHQATQMAVLKKGSPTAIPLIWVAPEAWLPRLTSHLAGDQPVFSFVLSKDELDSAGPLYRLEDLAASVVKKILELCPRETYVLCGFCGTSLLAYECAQQLRRLGYQIPLLLMGDSLLPGALRGLSFSDRSKRRLDRELYYCSAVLRADRSRWKELWNQRLGGFREMREERIWNRYHRSTNKKAQSVQELYQALVLANLTYVPAPYDGRVLYLQSGDRPQSDLWNLAASWEGFIEKLEVYEAPGDHTSLFKEPNVGFTAARIQRALEDVPAEPSMQHELVSSWSRSVSVADGTLGSLP